MSTHLVIEANGLRYLVAEDVRTVYQALISGRVLDEISGLPIPPVYSITATRHGTGRAMPEIATRVMDGGFYCLSGYLEQVFPAVAPAVAYQVDLVVTAPSYRNASPTVVIPPGAIFPVPVPDVLLRPLPLRLQGRVTRASDGNPLAGAFVTLVDDPHPAGLPPGHIVALRYPLAGAHPGPGGPAAAVTPMGPQGGLRNLTANASAGTIVVQLNDRTGLVPGDVLYLGAMVRGDGLFAELALPSPPVVALPGAVELTSPLPHDVASGTTAQGFTPAGPLTPLAMVAAAGDGLILTQALIVASAVAVADPGGAATEYRLVGALADGAGYYRLDGIGRVATVFVSASLGALAAGPIPWTLLYGQPVNVIDLQVA
jgi:hypothetical protein